MAKVRVYGFRVWDQTQGENVFSEFMRREEDIPEQGEIEKRFWADVDEERLVNGHIKANEVFDEPGSSGRIVLNMSNLSEKSKASFMTAKDRIAPESKQYNYECDDEVSESK